MKRLLFFLSVFATTTTAAQNIADALRYSQQDVTGTARFAGAGGAFTALGADFGAISVNPAGAAMYRRSEFVIGTGLRFHETETSLNSTSSSYSERRNHFNLDNIGLAISIHTPGRKWRTFNTVIGYNRLANYNRKYYYEGKAPGSIINAYFDDARATGNNTQNWYPYGARLAYDANAIYTGPDGLFTTDFESNRTASVQHWQSVSEKGGMGELLFGFAGNYKEKLMLGLTAGVPLLNYSLNSNYGEIDKDAAVEYFDGLTLNESLRTEGVGFNLKLGMIYRASQALRIGAAFHTPTFMKLNDSFNSDMAYSYTDGGGATTKRAQSPEGLFDYKLNTPFRSSVGAAYIFGSNGFVSADLEMVDYANMAFDLGNEAAFERELNRGIEQAYTTTVNLRLGGELALQEFRVRGGLQHLGNPYETGGRSRMVYTGGFGYRDNDFYLDLTYRNIQSSFSIKPYEAGANSLNAKSNAANHDFMLTLGFKF